MNISNPLRSRRETSAAPRTLPPLEATVERGGRGALVTQSDNYDRSASVVSTKGKLAANAEQRKQLALLSDGTLLIAAGSELDTYVLSYRAQLRRQGVVHRVVTVSAKTVLDLYSRTEEAVLKEEDDTDMQREAATWLQDAANRRASDLHIRVNASTCEILFRIHGDLLPIRVRDEDYGRRLVRCLYHSIADIGEDTFKENTRLDARIGDRKRLPDNLYGVRIASSPKDDGFVMVLRMLYNDTCDSTDVCDLGFSPTHRALIQAMKERPIGMNIISGPTGSGKSTTLQRILIAQIQEDRGTRNVITVEDPPEYPIPNSVQTAVTGADNAEKRDEAFGEAIMGAMRLDPDTMMIGEVRDAATARAALRASITGHQVWTTVHANDAMSIIDRMVDLGVPIGMVADSNIVTGLVAQRLVKKMCPHCRLPLANHQTKVPAKVVERVKRALGSHWMETFITNPDGCEKCDNGVIGRTVIAEIIVPDPQFMQYIMRGEKILARRHWIEKQSGQTFLQHAIQKIRDGEIDPVVAEKLLGRLTMDEVVSDALVTVGELVD